MTHDTNRTIKRNLNLTLGKADTAEINPISDRLDVYMDLSGVAYPLGRFIFTDFTAQKFTSGSLANVALVDQMYIIDQELEIGYGGRNQVVTAAIIGALQGFPFEYEIEASSFISGESWAAGTRRGQVLSTLATTGDYFTPWFGSDKKLHFIRAFDPATKVPAFDFDAGNQVLRASITETNDLLSAPNRIPIYGVADIPISAPHSVPNRGFVIPQVIDLQSTDKVQAAAIARNLALRQSVLEYTNVTTASDPRHDSYDVIFWDDQLWLEVGWSMQLVSGGQMTHTLQKAYS
jgi:hypothetical protein